MNALLFLKSPIELILILTAFFALLTQLQLNKKTPSILGTNNPVLLKWHRWLGWIAIGGYVLTRLIYLLAETYPAYPLKTQHFTHGVIIVICAVAFLRAVWVTHRKVKRKKKRVFTWGVTVFVLGASFTTITCALIAWRWANPPVTWGNNNWLIYQASILGHVALVLALIWQGRLALATGRESNQINNFEVSERQAGSEFTKTREKHQF